MGTDIFQNSPIDIDIDIDIFQNSLIDIDIDIFRMALSISISIFSKNSLSISISIYSRTALSISISISIFSGQPYRYQQRYFQNGRIDINIDIDIFQICRCIDYRYKYSIFHRQIMKDQNRLKIDNNDLIMHNYFK